MKRWTMEEHRESMQRIVPVDKFSPIDWNDTHKRFGDYNYKKLPKYKRLIVVVCEECRTRSIMQAKYCRYVCFECLPYSQQAILTYFHDVPPLYPKWFSEKLKEDVRKRFGNKCFLCGKKQSALPRKLDVHHINGNKQCEDINNLVPLCPSCHHDGDEDKIRIKMEKWLRRRAIVRSHASIKDGLRPEHKNLYIM